MKKWFDRLTASPKPPAGHLHLVPNRDVAPAPARSEVAPAPPAPAPLPTDIWQRILDKTGCPYTLAQVQDLDPRDPEDVKEAIRRVAYVHGPMKVRAAARALAFAKGRLGDPEAAEEYWRLTREATAVPSPLFIVTELRTRSALADAPRLAPTMRLCRTTTPTR